MVTVRLSILILIALSLQTALPLRLVESRILGILAYFIGIILCRWRSVAIAVFLAAVVVSRDDGVMPAVIVNEGGGVVEIGFFPEVGLLSCEVLPDLFVLALDIFDLALEVFELYVQRADLLVPLETASLVHRLRGGRVH